MVDILRFEFWSAEERAAWELAGPELLKILFAGIESGTMLLPESISILTSWEYINEHAIAWLDAWRGGTFAGITNYTRQQATGYIQDWISSGEHLDVLKAKLAPLFDERRAEIIATTEVTRAYAEGNLIAWRSTSVIGGKRWMTANDERVCPICGPLHNQVVSLSGAWTMDDAGNVVEGLGVTAPPAHPRCRCWLQPIVDVEMVRQARLRRLGLQ